MSNKRICYFIPVDGLVEGEGFRVSIVTEGEPGHSPTGTWPCSPSDVRPYFWGFDYKKAVEAADRQNAKMGHSPEDDLSDRCLVDGRVPSMTKARGAATGPRPS